MALIPDELHETVYGDLLRPAVKTVGKTLNLIARAINAALTPLELWIVNKEYNAERTKLLLEKELEGVEPEKIVSPEAYVAVPALQAISYCMDSESLRGMFAKLLAKSMNSDSKDNVHPAFVEIIKQMSPFDATVLSGFLGVGAVSVVEAITS